ncbi:molybdenum cofactor biosynthesis protein MoaE [Alkalibacillus aidingensis]|uniref:molybdenum cofactor biosynthesis protein MoaE n=1 Tax=Alkalibacillus aidingensis TaxID=2747607 RepID=UPI002948B82F|nr:molybdenum cofactor biosynthesis protein MoaE [Alkalibacillus aidingensis]
MKKFEITDQPLEERRDTDKVLNSSHGAVTTFTGHVREWTNGLRTEYLSFEAYTSMAEKKMEEIGEEVKQKWKGCDIAIAHRVGLLNISDIAVVVTVSSPHRKAAYEANEYAMERLKQDVPIWKKEIWDNGEVWVGHQNYKPKGSERND